MSVSDKMTALMDSVRGVSNTSDKLNITAATSILSAPASMLAVPLDPKRFATNQCTKELINDSGAKFVSLGDGNNIGTYFSYPDGMKPGAYLFECMARGTMVLNRFAEENEHHIYINGADLKGTQWTMLRVPFFATTNSVFDIFGRGSKGQWFEIDHPCFIKVGG